jgi:hypothetical protein
VEWIRIRLGLTIEVGKSRNAGAVASLIGQSEDVTDGSTNAVIFNINLANANPLCYPN